MRFASRVGRFKVAGRFFQRLAPGEGVNLFAGMVVLDVRRDFMCDEVEYVAIHPDFRPREQGELLPEYVAQFSRDSANPTWVEKTPNDQVKGPARQGRSL